MPRPQTSPSANSKPLALPRAKAGPLDSTVSVEFRVTEPSRFFLVWLTRFKNAEALWCHFIHTQPLWVPQKEHYLLCRTGTYIKRTTTWDEICSTYLAGRVWAKRHPREDSVWKVKAKEMTRMVGERWQGPFPFSPVPPRPPWTMQWFPPTHLSRPAAGDPPQGKLPWLGTGWKREALGGG